MLEPIYILFENGIFLEAKSFGVSGTKVGEIVFNTSLSGYQEISSDPSYAGQFVVFSMPEIGIVGVNEYDMESRSIFAKGVIVRSYNESYSNFRAKNSFSSLLKKHDCLGICNIDTRALVGQIRDFGTQHIVASTSISDIKKLEEILKDSKKIHEINYIEEVSTKDKYSHIDSTFCFEDFKYKKALKSSKKVAVLDFGVKRNILNELANANLDIEVLPQSYDEKALIKDFEDKKLSGIFISNGPGDPLTLKDQVEKIKKLIEARIPIFGICLGHQLLSIAFGFDTYKLKFGHHGANHPVKNLNTNAVEITAQNHNYNVVEEISSIADITHRNLFDNTIEGVRYKNYPIISLQHHPEASPGPRDCTAVFKEFEGMLSCVR